MIAKFEAKTTPWEIKESEFPSGATIEEKLKFLLRYAILAPSSHNSQPWKFSIKNNGLLLFTDQSRWLNISDADQRELYISAGCALENLLIAAEHFGFGHLVEYFPEGENSPVASVKLNPNNKPENPRDNVLFDMIQRRSTNHNLYDARPISEADMARLHDCCYEDGFWLFPTNEAHNEAELRRKIDDLITRADACQLTDKAYKEELAWWVGQGVFGAPWLMAKVSQLAITYLNISKGQTKKDSDMLLSAPSLVALGSAFNDRKSQVITGQIFERIALSASYMGLAVHPMSQILEVPEIKAELTSLLPKQNVFPQHTFRLGYAEPEKEHTPRRQLNEVLTRNFVIQYAS
jgi:nitroreductase